MSPTLEVVDRWDGGFSWTVEGDKLKRISLALATAEGVWLVDPIDAPGLDEEIEALGEVVGVTLLLDRHKRDTEALARRYDVPVSLPAALSPVAKEMTVETERYSETLPGTNYRAIPLTTNRLWREVALFDPESKTLIVPEAVGTNDLFTTADERLGVHPGLRLFPPREQLESLNPERILVGHGPGIFDDAATALRSAMRSSRRNAPRIYAKAAVLPFK